MPLMLWPVGASAFTLPFVKLLGTVSEEVCVAVAVPDTPFDVAVESGFGFRWTVPGAASAFPFVGVVVAVAFAPVSAVDDVGVD